RGLLDAMMPAMGAVAVTKRIMDQAPTPVIIFTEHSSARNAAAAFEATKAGALDVVARPSGVDPLGAEAAAFRDLIKALSSVRVVRRRRTQIPERRARRPEVAREQAATFGVVAICASTGGPAARAPLL